MESVKSYTSGWTTSKSSMIKTHSKLHNDSENSYHEISQPRLKDLCADDKAKIGELVKKVALEKNQRLQIQNKVAKEMKDKQRELRNVKKLNKRLYEEAKNVRAQYEKSKEILEAYKQIATPAILSTPKSPSVFKNTNQEWKTNIQQTPIENYKTHAELYSTDCMFESPDLDKRLIIDTFSPISNRFQESYDKKITILSERATSPIDFDTKKSKLHDVSIQTVCDQEIQTNLCNPGERKTSRAVEIESLSSSDMKPRNYLQIKAERLPKRYFDTSQSKETTKNHLKIPIKRLEDQLVPEKYLRSQYLNSKSSRNLNYNHAFKEHSEEELNSLRSEVSALSSSIRILTGKSSLKSSPQMQLSSSSVYDSLYHNPLLAESLEGSSRVQSILKKSSNYEPSAIETPHDLDVNNSQSFRLNDLVFSNIKQAAPDISHKFYDDKLFELVEDLENMEDNKLSVSQTHKSSSKTKFQFDSKLMSIIDNFEMEDESLEYSQSLMNSKRSNHKEDSFEGLREKAVNLRKDIRK